MTGEINLPTLPPAPATGPAPLPPTGELLKLLEPQTGLIDPGKTANAEVIALKQGGDAFQLLLKLTLEGGRQTLVQASSAQPLPLGSNVAVSQTPTGNLTITLQQALSANVAALTRIDTTQMPEGTLLQAKVLTTQMLPQGATQPAIYRSLVTVLNNALAGTTLTLESPQPLRVGSLLSAVVQNAQTLNFVPLSGLKDQLAVAQQLSTQQSRQGSLDVVFTALQNLPADDSTSSDLRAAAARLLAALPDLAQVSNPKVLAQLVQNSGAFLEAKLLVGQNPQIPPAGHERRPAAPGRRPGAGPAHRHPPQRHPRRQYLGPGAAELCAQPAEYARPDQRPASTCRVSAAGSVDAAPGGRRRPGKPAAPGRRGDFTLAEPPAVEPGADRHHGRWSTADHLAAGNPHAHLAGHRALAGQVPTRRTHARQGPARTQRQKKTPSRCSGASSWRSTWSRWGRCRFRRN